MLSFQHVANIIIKIIVSDIFTIQVVLHLHINPDELCSRVLHMLKNNSIKAYLTFHILHLLKYTIWNILTCFYTMKSIKKMHLSPQKSPYASVLFLLPTAPCFLALLISHLNTQTINSLSLSFYLYIYTYICIVHMCWNVIHMALHSVYFACFI